MNRFYFNQKGSILMLMAVTIPFLFAISAIAVDCGYLYVQRSHMQNMADAAVLAGASKLGVGTADAQSLALTYIDKNKKALDGKIALDNGIKFDFPNKNNVKKIRVDIEESIRFSQLPFMSSVISLFKFSDDPIKLTVYAIASYSGSAPGIFDHSIISGGDGTFYLMGEWGSGGNKFNGLIHVNGIFQFDKNSEKGYGTDNIPSTGTEINAPITITAKKYDIGGLNKTANQVLASKFSYGTDKIDITEANPTVKAKIDSLTNKANTFSTSHPASAAGGSGVDALKLTTPLYVEGNLGSGYSTKNIISGPYSNGGVVKNDVVIVATGDIALNFSSITFSNTATITLISLTGNIMLSGGNMMNVNALAPHGSITVNGGGTTINGYLIGQSVSLGQGARKYQNSNWSGGSGGSGKVRLIE